LVVSAPYASASVLNFAQALERLSAMAPKEPKTSKQESSGEYRALQVTERDQTLTPRQLRSAGFLPATLYGKASSKGLAGQSVNIQVRERDFTRSYKEGSRIFKFDGLSGQLVRVSQLQVEAVSQKVLNVEFVETTQAEAKASEAARAQAEHEAELARQELARKIAEEAANRPDEEEAPPGPAVAPEPETAAAV